MGGTLAQEHGIARQTAAKTLRMLEAEGLVYRGTWPRLLREGCCWGIGPLGLVGDRAEVAAAVVDADEAGDEHPVPGGADR